MVLIVVPTRMAFRNSPRFLKSEFWSSLLILLVPNVIIFSKRSELPLLNYVALISGALRLLVDTKGYLRM